MSLFQGLLERLKHDVIRILSQLQIKRQDEAEEIERQRREQAAKQELAFQHARFSGSAESSEAEKKPPEPRQPVVRSGVKVGRNDPCPCGSGKKYKQCHGALS